MSQVQPPVTSNESAGQPNDVFPNSIVQTTAGLTIGQPPAPLGLPPAVPVTVPTVANPDGTYPTAPVLPYPAIPPYPTYNPLAYGVQPYPVVPPIGHPAAVNPYYAYQYAAYSNYYQQPAAAALLPQTTPQVTVAGQAKAKNEDPNKNKNKKNKNKNQQPEPEVEDEEEDDDPTVDKGMKSSKANNVLPFWGNEKTMNLNPLILTNVQNSPYFKNDLYQLKSYHEVIDEIYYQVKHLGKFFWFDFQLLSLSNDFFFHFFRALGAWIS